MNVSGELLSESGIQELIGWLAHIIEAAGALIIFAGAVWACCRLTIRLRAAGVWGPAEQAEPGPRTPPPPSMTYARRPGEEGR